MKTHITTLFTLLVFTVFGQKEPYIPEPGEWLHFQSSTALLMGTPAGYTADQKANSQGIMLFSDRNFGFSPFSIGMGLGYSAHYYHGDHHIIVNPDGTYVLEDLEPGTYLKNRFGLEYADLALELRYRSRANNKGRYWRLYVGGLAGYKVDSYSYFQSQTQRVKYYNIEGFNRFRYGVYAKFGRGPVNLYGYYGLSPLVTSGVLSPAWNEVTTANLGLSITL